MSTHTSLEAALKTDLVSAGVVTAEAQVYSGRRPQKVTRSDGEVWVERLPTEQIGRGLHRVTRHPYLIHVIGRPSNAGPAGTGEAQLETVEAKAETLVDRYDGTLPSEISDALSGTLVGVLAREESADEDPDDAKRHSFSIRVEITEAA